MLRIKYVDRFSIVQRSPRGLKFGTLDSRMLRIEPRQRSKHGVLMKYLTLSGCINGHQQEKIKVRE